MTKPAIEVKNLSKSYIINHKDRASYKTIKDDFTSLIKRPFGGLESHEEKFWALKDVSFEVAQGEIFGVIGRNGSGKSTLLKILSRIVQPTNGETNMRGRVASLLEVGTGFHPELTGRENIFFNGSMLGMSKKEIEKKFDEIVAFSEVEKFIDTPVKFYSSGMYVRLAFSVAAHLEPDILILDEVLSVGDAAFQKKSLNKILETMNDGRTIIFVSHSMDSVQQLCTRAMLLNKGQVEIIGDTKLVTEKYLEGNLSRGEREALVLAEKNFEISKSEPPTILKEGEITQVRAVKHVFKNFTLNGNPIERNNIILSGKKIKIECDYTNTGVPRDLLIGYAFKDKKTKSFPIFIHNKLENELHITGKSGHISMEISPPKLRPGEYSVEINVWLDDKMFLENEEITKFKMVESPTFASKQLFPSFPSEILVDSSWSFYKES